MTRLIHLSDLHFGATTPGLLDPLCQKVAELAPDLVVISGDLTQRARAAQFAEARAFIARLGAPVICVPGNHDIPLWNIWQRLFRPWQPWRHHFSNILEPDWRCDRLVVVGLNTADPRAWKRGRITSVQLDRVARRFADAGPRARIVVMHHPLEHLPEETQWLMAGATEALQRLPEAGAQIVLSGHIHVSHAGPFTAAPGLIFVQAGTGLSYRRRAEANAFNLLDFGPEGVEIRTLLADDTGRFTRADLRHSHRFTAAL